MPVAEAHLLDYFKIVYRRRWVAATAFFVIFIGVIIYTFTATPLYESRAQLLIDVNEPNVVSFREVVEQGKATDDYYQTQYKILQSRSLAKRTLGTLKLFDHPFFAGERTTHGLAAAIGAVVVTARRFAGLGKSVEQHEPSESAKESAAYDAFLRGLTIAPVRDSRLVDLKFTSPDGVMSAHLVNALARAYIAQNLEYKFLASKQASDWLKQRLAEQRGQVEASELALQRYREEGDAVALEDRQNIIVQKLADLNGAVTRAKTERFEKEALHNQVRAIQQDRRALDTFPAILSNSFIQQLKAELAQLQRQEAQLQDKLGERHPDLLKVRSGIGTAEAKLRAEVDKVVQSVRNEFLSSLAQERSLIQALEAQKIEALALNRKSIGYGVLRRDSDSNRQIYESLLQQAKETGISGELNTSNIRLVDEAEVPQQPVRPRKGLNLLLGALGGCFVGLGLAFFFEYLDNRVKSPDDITDQLGLPFLGLVPAARLSDSDPLLITGGVPPNFVEAFKTIRTNVLFSTADEGMRVIAVTSSQPAEGKTVVAANLAIGLAEAGERVLLIDADMRRPRLHDAFSCRAEPGLSNLLVGNAKMSESVRSSTVPGLLLLPSGRIPPNPAELLGSRRFRDFLASLKDQFDWVVIDSPPVLPVTDASVITTVCSGTVFVVGSDMTSRAAAEAALQQLSRVRAPIIGAVLNRVELDRHAYYYSQYYSRRYGQYYGTSAVA